MMKGVAVVQMAVLQSGCPIDPRMVADMRPAIPSLASAHVVPLPIHGITYDHPLLYIISATRLRELPALRNFVLARSEPLDPEELNALADAIDFLLVVYGHICSDQVTNVFRSIFTWAVKIPKEYVDLLANGNIQALLVYAYWLMLVGLMKECWWIDNMAESGLAEIILRCQEIGIAEDVLGKPKQMMEALRTG